MKIKKKAYVSFCVLVCALVAALLLSAGERVVDILAVASPPSGGRTIVIDAGHGGFDPGAMFGGIYEKDINLDIALRLYDIFRLNGYNCVMTRTEDADTADEGLPTISSRKSSDLKNRVALAESYSDAVYISIHQNAYSDRSQDGAQVFYGTENADSEQLAEICLSAINRYTQPDNRRQVKMGSDNIYILVTITCPTILVECGFMSNKAELEKLCSADYCNKIAFAIFTGYCEFEMQKTTKEE